MPVRSSRPLPTPLAAEPLLWHSRSGIAGTTAAAPALICCQWAYPPLQHKDWIGQSCAERLHLSGIPSSRSPDLCRQHRFVLCTRCSRARRGPSLQVDHDIEQTCGVPEQLSGEVEVAVLEGVPMVREALLLHRPTGTVLSADLLLAMDKNSLVSLGCHVATVPAVIAQTYSILVYFLIFVHSSRQVFFSSSHQTRLW